MKLILILSLAIITSCNFFGPNRNPAGEIYLETDEPVALGQIKLSTLQDGFIKIAKSSPIIESVERFEMDPVTRILSLSFTVNYPLESLYNFTKIPDGLKASDRHRIDLAVSFPETKTLAFTRYLGFSFHKFNIDGDSYLDAFEIVASVIKTVLANSELIDLLESKIDTQKKDISTRDLLREIIDNNGIVVFHTTKKINFKLNLSNFSHLNHYIEEYQNLRLWRFSPTLFQGKEVRFKFIAGEGKPSQKWMQNEEQDIKEDIRTLLQVRNDLYNEFGDFENIDIHNKNYLNQLLSNENITFSKLRKNYQNEINYFLNDLLSHSKKLLNRQNENFIADPEYEYIQYMDYAKVQLRNYISDLDRRLSIDYNILLGGKKDSLNGPIITKLLSENALNRGLNYLIDTEIENRQLLTSAQIFIQPQLPGFTFKGEVHLPLEFLLGKIDSKLLDKEFTNHITALNEGIPFEITLETKMGDLGKIGLDIKSFQVKSGKSKLNFKRTSKNQAFLIDFTKIYLAQTLSSLELDLNSNGTPEEIKANELIQIKQFISKIKSSYVDTKNLEKILMTDLVSNPYIKSGNEFVSKKNKILFGNIINFNERNKLFELHLDPSLLVDKVNNIKHNLQLWSVTPLYSKELNNNFLEFSIGSGLRSKKFIDEQYYRGGQLENSNFSGIYYELGKERSKVDSLISLHFNYLESYINQFLSDMVKLNNRKIEQLAENNPGESYFDVEHLELNITKDNKFNLDVKIKTAKKSRTWYTAFIGEKLHTDTYSISANLDLTSKKVTLKNTNISNLLYFPEAISVNPTHVQVKSGSPSLIDKAITAIINSGIRLGLNNGTVKKLLLKILNNSLSKLYSTKEGVMKGHEIEKVARIHTTENDILIFLNPKLIGSPFDIHLAHDEELTKGIILDQKNQTMHMAFSVGAGLAKSDKKELLDIIGEMDQLLKPYLSVNSKKELEDLLKDQQLVGKLLTNTDKTKLGLYQRYMNILTKYDQVLHFTNIKHQSKSEQYRLSATGAELMYFTALASKFEKSLNELISKMNKYNLKDSQYYYSTFVDSQSMIKENIQDPLLKTYIEKNLAINKLILGHEISYWTYSLYPDAYFANSIYEYLK